MSTRKVYCTNLQLEDKSSDHRHPDELKENKYEITLTLVSSGDFSNVSVNDVFNSIAPVFMSKEGIVINK